MNPILEDNSSIAFWPLQIVEFPITEAAAIGIGLIVTVAVADTGAQPPAAAIV